MAESQSSSCFSIAELINFLFFSFILNWVTAIRKLCTSTSLSGPSLLQSTTRTGAPGKSRTAANVGEIAERVFMRSEEVEMVARNMGLELQGHGQHPIKNRDDLCCMFEEQEPSLEEVREAFVVFDRNGDGFIDGGELGSVLRMLGLREGSSVDLCRRMIDAFDENRDGRIDFREFVKIMETSFS